ERSPEPGLASCRACLDLLEWFTQGLPITKTNEQRARLPGPRRMAPRSRVRATAKESRPASPTGCVVTHRPPSCRAKQEVDTAVRNADNRVASTLVGERGATDGGGKLPWDERTTRMPGTDFICWERSAYWRWHFSALGAVGRRRSKR